MVQGTINPATEGIAQCCISASFIVVRMEFIHVDAFFLVVNGTFIFNTTGNVTVNARMVFSDSLISQNVGHIFCVEGGLLKLIKIYPPPRVQTDNPLYTLDHPAGRSARRH